MWEKDSSLHKCRMFRSAHALLVVKGRLIYLFLSLSLSSLSLSCFFCLEPGIYRDICVPPLRLTRQYSPPITGKAHQSSSRLCCPVLTHTPTSITIQSSSYEYPFPQPCCSQSKSRCTLEPAPRASCHTCPWPPPRLLTSRSSAPARLVCPPCEFPTRQFDPSVPVVPCATRLLLTPSALVIRMCRHSLARPSAQSARL